MARRLWVEGPDDKHVLLHVLSAHGLSVDELDETSSRPRPREDLLYVGVTRSANWQGIRNRIVAMPANEGDVEGFVFDMDSPEHGDRPWPSIRIALEGRLPGEAVPALPPDEGWVALTTTTPRVGVWAMPRGARDGGLEDFLWDGVSPEHPLRSVVEAAVRDAERVHPDLRRDGGSSGRLPSAWRPKARVHTWLALQAEPGRPLGLAWKTKVFAHGTESEQALVAWVKRLFGV